MNKTSMTLTAAAVMACAATAAQAAPTYTSGSVTMNNMVTLVKTAVSTTTNFPLTKGSFVPGSPSGSFTSVVLPATIPFSAGAVNFGAPADESFNDAGIGKFTATKATQEPAPANFANWASLSGSNGLSSGAVQNVVFCNQQIVVQKNDSLFILTQMDQVLL